MEGRQGSGRQVRKGVEGGAVAVQSSDTLGALQKHSGGNQARQGMQAK